VGRAPFFEAQNSNLTSIRFAPSGDGPFSHFQLGGFPNGDRIAKII
jgi:hypothetical protein